MRGLLGTVRAGLGWLLGVCRGPVMGAYVFLPVALKQRRDSRQFPASKAGVAGRHWVRESVAGESPKWVPSSPAG